MTAYVFPGQGAQFTGMGQSLYSQNPVAKAIFEEADEVLGFSLSKVMFTGTADQLRQTNVTQPAIFVHSIAALKITDYSNMRMVAGHSLGEFSALAASGSLLFAEALRLVSVRASAMQAACDSQPGTMAAVLAMADEQVEAICRQITEDTGASVVAANYNCPGQLVISGALPAVEAACTALKAAGAKRAMILPVGGAFHSPLMAPARTELAAVIAETRFQQPSCPVYQNVVARAVTEADEIKQNLIAQLTGAVKWTQCVQAMAADGATRFVECGPGKVLQGLISKIIPGIPVSGIQ